MVINKRSKMQRTNNKVRAWLEANDYQDIWFFPHTKYSKDYIFRKEGFDGIASHKDRLVLFQCKSNKKITKAKLKRYNELSIIFGIECLWFNSPDRKPLQINNQPAETFSMDEDYYF